MSESPRSYWGYDYAPKRRQIKETMAEIERWHWEFAQALSDDRDSEQTPPKRVPLDISQWGSGPIDEQEFTQLLAKIDRIWDGRLDTGYEGSWSRFCNIGPEIATRLALAPADDEHRRRLTDYFAYSVVTNRTDWGYLERTARHIMAAIGLPNFRLARIETRDEIEEEPHEPALNPVATSFAQKKATGYVSEGFGLIFDTIDCEEAYHAVVSDMTGCIRDSVMHAYLERMLIELQAQGDPQSDYWDAATDKLPRGIVRYVDLLEPSDLCNSDRRGHYGGLYGNNDYWIEHSYGPLYGPEALIARARERAEQKLRDEERERAEQKLREAQAAIDAPEAQVEAAAAALAREQALREWLANDAA